MDDQHRRLPFRPAPVATHRDEDATVAPAHRDMPQDAATSDATPVATGRDMSGDIATPPEDAPLQEHSGTNPASRQQPADRDAYTLTVEDVAVRLADEDIYRDPRTIQRWCKSGRLACILDSENGEKYLIEPGSLEKIVATLLRERERHARGTSRHPSRPEADMSRSMPRQEETRRDDDAAPVATDRDVPRPEPDRIRDSVATAAPEPASDGGAESRIRQLENELAMAKADKQVREQMVDYLKGQFGQMLDGALDRAEKIGALQAENTRLKSLLEAGNRDAVDNPETNRAPEGVE